MVNICEEMPVLARHAGDWMGTYTLIDTAGQVLDTHQSHLTCTFPETGEFPYLQTNRYRWADGKREEYQFPGQYCDKRLWFDTERIKGHAWEVDNSTIILWLTYKGIPEEMYIYEMIQISPCNKYRARTWQWFRNHQIYQRTIIQEERVAS